MLSWMEIDMATELFSIWGGLTGWRSQHGDGYQVTSTLEGVGIWYVARESRTVERAFSRACRRTIFRRIFPWMAPPPGELPVHKVKIE